ncbi:PTS sugar transporter subunit IIA [Paenibacillus sp. HN-1]|uniref:PTS sugar transporter subunit IIA n=1 Tax=Paenibacillus TaxID=44249 RepID=UPI001CA969EB|nr:MULTISPECIES: PTS sugar transporter subunit IIA [Paenibacillus]MBY9077811.1 PTS sugar transporter subunit IIA [Paenibacillus sp. CGMCC 1.18879]MBY9088233.1 PTS sugar transporter subunit IIA [Paenibacillus sinensis]
MKKLISIDTIMLNLDAGTKDEAIALLADNLERTGRVASADVFMQSVLDREAVSPTAIGYDMGLPHGKSDTVLIPSVSIARLKRPLLWNEETNEAADLLILIAVPKESSGFHLKILTALSRKLMHDEFREKLRNASAETDILKLVDQELGELIHD